eukprot:3935805-Pleurochrysis_carterae.AAC.1
MKLGKHVVQDEAGDSSDDEVMPTQLPTGPMSAPKDGAASGVKSGGVRLQNERAWVEKGASE